MFQPSGSSQSENSWWPCDCIVSPAVLVCNIHTCVNSTCVCSVATQVFHHCSTIPSWLPQHRVVGLWLVHPVLCADWMRRMQCHAQLELLVINWLFCATPVLRDISSLFIIVASAKSPQCVVNLWSGLSTLSSVQTECTGYNWHMKLEWLSIGRPLGQLLFLGCTAHC